MIATLLAVIVYRIKHVTAPPSPKGRAEREQKYEKV